MLNLYNQITSDLKRCSNQQRARKHSIYHKKGGYVSWGVSSTDFKLITKKHKKTIKELTAKESLDLASKFYRSDVEDQIYIGNFIFSANKDKFGAFPTEYFDKALNHFHTWGTIDDFCVHVLNNFLVSFPQQVITLLRKWNRSPNLWKRRASIVAFTRNIGFSGKFTDTALKLCENLIKDKEDLVQKGVGWALKDCMRGDKAKVLDYVKEIRKKKAPSTIVLYSIRDLNKSERQTVLNIR